MDIDTDGGTILVLGRGPSTVQAVREADADWGLIPYAAPRLRERIEAERVREMGDLWLVAIEGGHAEELDRDRATLAYAPAWRATSA